MKYKLTVIKYENNDNYEAEMAKFKEIREYNRYNQMRNGDVLMMNEEPKRELADRSLEVFLTEEEYKKVKAEVMKVFE